MTGNGRQPKVAIVGGGPAGISAAISLGRYGVKSMLIDEGSAFGGQYYKHYSADPKTSRGDDLDSLRASGDEIRGRLLGLPVEPRSNTTVWGFSRPNQLALLSGDEVEVLRPSAILLAAGAIDRTIAFPGWTLPGVVTAGGIQRLLSHDGILPGNRFLLAGTGPLLLVIAVQIAEAGGKVAAVVDCAGFTEPVRGLRSAIEAARQLSRIRQWARYRRKLRRLGIPYLQNSTVVRATGTDRLETVVVVRKRVDWQLVPDSEQSFDVDTLGLHYGLAASLELAHTMDCRCSYAETLGGWHITTDADMRTDQPGIYAAGQVAGIGGAELAEQTGELAALTVATDLGLLAPADMQAHAAPLRQRIARSRGFATLLNSAFTASPGAGRLVEPDTLLCRCEEVDAAQVDHAVETGATTLNEIKRHTRCGMGFCQGRICAQTIATYIHQRHNIDPRDAGMFTARTPVRPVPLSALASLPDDLDEE